MQGILFYNLKMKYFILYGFCLLLCSKNFAAPEGEIKLEKNKNNFVLIQGSSNINEFELKNDSPSVENASSNPGYHIIKIKVDEFAAENLRMVKDFKQLINASEHPYIRIAVQNKEKSDFEETNGLTNFNIRVTLAGISEEYTVPCQLNNQPNGSYTIEGNFAVKLTEFKLDPPVKLFGLVKVNNTVFVNFVFHFYKSATEKDNLEV